MSVLQNPIVGRMKQKIGGVVMSTWKGINVMRGKPLTVANPKTDAQLMRRSALTQIVAIARTIVAAISNGFREQAVKKSAFNAFTGYNLRNAFNYAAPPAATIVPADVLVSQGTISPTPINALANSSITNLAVFTFDNTAILPGQSAADTARCVLYNEATDKWYAPSTTALRSTGTLSAVVPASFWSALDIVRGYLYFYNSTDRKSSDSVNTTDGVS